MYISPLQTFRRKVTDPFRDGQDQLLALGQSYIVKNALALVGAMEGYDRHACLVEDGCEIGIVEVAEIGRLAIDVRDGGHKGSKIIIKKDIELTPRMTGLEPKKENSPQGSVKPNHLDYPFP